ncbi:hypothetical protein [Nonomuraea sp. NPDC049684]|uniref:hypothetical protein n=1 Tax=Nonomuraea sp. NPDC049684 TaxID=3364356 RepID=UPI0037A7B412
MPGEVVADRADGEPAALVAYAVARRMIGQPLVAKDVYAPPVILIGIGLHSLLDLRPTALDVTWLAVTALIGVAFGAPRAATTQVFPRTACSGSATPGGRWSCGP